MAIGDSWKNFWESKFASSVSNDEADRLTAAVDEDLNRLSQAELVEFLNVQKGESVLDAGCGSGGTAMLIHAVADRIVAVDFSAAAIERARRRASERGVKNIEWRVGDISEMALPERAFDRILCLSVFHYLSDDQVRKCLASFSSLLRKGGELVLHVKNLASPYLRTLECAKRIRAWISPRMGLSEHFRPWRWYFRELRNHGFEVMCFNSFNLVRIEGLPSGLVRRLQKWELEKRDSFPLSSRWLRLHGADLKIRSKLTAGSEARQVLGNGNRH
jgi:ubiquinone/menaquinone biosynthesis C-methylase UbiE